MERIASNSRNPWYPRAQEPESGLTLIERTTFSWKDRRIRAWTTADLEICGWPERMEYLAHLRVLLLYFRRRSWDSEPVPVLEGVTDVSASLLGSAKCILGSKLRSAVVVVPELDPVTGVSAHRRSVCLLLLTQCSPPSLCEQRRRNTQMRSSRNMRSNSRGNKTGSVVGPDDESRTHPDHFHDTVGHHDQDHDHVERHRRDHVDHGSFLGAFRGWLLPIHTMPRTRWTKPWSGVATAFGRWRSRWSFCSSRPVFNPSSSSPLAQRPSWATPFTMLRTR